MRLPWVRRSLLNMYRRMYNEAVKSSTANKGKADILAEQLRIAQQERSDLQLKLLRVGFGINPFHELVAGTEDRSSVLPDASPSTVPPKQAQPWMSAEEVQATYVQEAAQLFPGNLQKIAAHVNRRQAEFYEGRGRVASTPVSAEEMRAARAVEDDVLAAIEEGKAAVAKG
jgi:hypothetical protein